MLKLPGAIHIHTSHSDGSADIEQIAQAAKKAGLKWIIITDHNKIAAKEGFYHGVCVITGDEISPEGENHYLALNAQKHIDETLPIEEIISQVKIQGALGFVAHPDESEDRKNSYKPIRWQNFDLREFDGIEIWNHLSDWGDGYDATNIFKGIYSFLFKNNILKGPSKRVLSWWDEINNEEEKITPAIFGVDAHCLNIGKFIFKVKVFTYLETFKTLTNFILVKNPLPQEFEVQKKIILDGIKNGRNLMVNQALKNGENVVYKITNAKGEADLGESIALEEESKIILRLPEKAELKIIRNGEIIYAKNSKEVILPITDKGKYRFEAYLKNRPWIFSNPILVK